MTMTERLRHRGAMNIIDYKLLGKPHQACVPSKEQLESIAVAITAMKRRMDESGLPLQRHISVLMYHINHPSAIIFKDNNTMDALEAGILAIQWLINTDPCEDA